MTVSSHPVESQPGIRPYQRILCVIAVVWLGGSLAATGLAMYLQPQSLAGLDAPSVGWISIASGLVAMVSVLPGCGIQETRTAEAIDPTNPRGELSHSTVAERLGNAFLVGMMIRLAGTVALFLVSSYYLGVSVLEPNSEASSLGVTATQIAIWVLGWHLVLLLAEVVMLARELQRPVRFNESN